MDRVLLLRFFSGNTTFPEERFIREWVEESEENFRSFIYERMIFDALILNFHKGNHTKKNSPACLWRKGSRIRSGGPVSRMSSWLSAFN